MDRTIETRELYATLDGVLIDHFKRGFAVVAVVFGKIENRELEVGVVGNQKLQLQVPGLIELLATLTSDYLKLHLEATGEIKRGSDGKEKTGTVQ